ncbi:hypothetical protein DL766_006399 [Monosporascus sp. MC13-8B]|uniref:Uncharacterized protein n=1 Tax=Monosporascus cannonballus TaxID=155416 RepID=A0ABY0H701_9PEZI|nr:hypothetical protein DL763_010448 [Monosporascus cannonballus]RYO83284.1 hypothetical protein DL762_006193 [Monosporascus cannonballus]RYP27402.1 hypothetical protein DL766_006399 [Monosporascus sp. MC13-8B]
MAIAREPSLRSRTGWMKWGSSSNISADSAPSIAPESPREIVHLGGSRVNTPDLDSFISAVREERLTLWPVGPPPEPPTGEPKSQGVWPLTPASDVSSNPNPSPGLRPDPLRTQGTTPWDKAAPSPAFSSRTYSGVSLVDPPVAAGQPRLLRRSQSTNELQQRRMQQHQQLPSPSRSTSRERRLHWSSSSHGSGGFGGGIGSCLSSRAQQQKTLPPQPEEREDHQAAPAHVATLMTKDSSAPGAKSLPPPAGPPPSMPLPIIKEPSAQNKETSTAAAPTAITTGSGNSTQPKSRRPPRHTPQERLWLHRNYRGEAPFLKAWGLSINSEEDREEGKTILQDLMRGEEEESSSTARLSSASSSYSQRGPNYEPERHSKTASDEGLHVILEEETRGRLTVESWDSKGNRISQGDLQNLRTSATELSSQIGSKEHARSGSEDSVLHTYLRTWDKR